MRFAGIKQVIETLADNNIVTRPTSLIPKAAVCDGGKGVARTSASVGGEQAQNHVG